MTNATLTRPLTDSTHLDQVGVIDWVPLTKMRASLSSQRELRPSRVDHLAANFDPEEIGTPVVNLRDGVYWIIDGQHRIEAMRQVGWGDQSVQCKIYEGLTPEQEAERFLKQNDVLAVTAFDKFDKAVKAGRPVEVDIDRVLRMHGLHVSRHMKTTGSVSAVGTLQRVYKRGGAKVLSLTLSLVTLSYGDSGLVAPVIDGLGLFMGRYQEVVKMEKVVERLAGARGGLNALVNDAAKLQKQTGNQLAHCIAAAAVDIYNRGRGGAKLPAWWRADEGAE